MISFTIDKPEKLYIKYKEATYVYVGIKDVRYWIKRYRERPTTRLSIADLQTDINSAVIALLVFILLERK